MSEGWVLDASPIITLAKVGHLDLLVRVAPDIGIPQAVFGEITTGPEDDLGRRALEKSKRSETCNTVT